MDTQSIDYMDCMDLEDLEVLRRIFWLRRPNNSVDHSYDDNRVNPFDQSDEGFRNIYGFSKRFGTKIVDLLSEDLVYDRRGNAVSPKLQVVCALRNWTRHENQDNTAGLHGVSQPTISKICKKIAGSLAQMSDQFIKMPVTLEDEEEIMRKFSSISNFPNVIGVIDCSQIKMKKFKTEDSKGCSPINIQMVCDADLKIMDIVTEWPGSINNSRVFVDCHLKQRFEAGEFSGKVLGNSGYPCTQYLFTPVPDPITEAEQRYNISHIPTRNTMQKCFEVWKQRFPCLLRGMYGDNETARQTIIACAILHNIALEMHEDLGSGEDVFVQPNPSSEPIPISLNISNSIQDISWRSHFIDKYFS